MTLNHDDKESYIHWCVTLAIKVKFLSRVNLGPLKNIRGISFYFFFWQDDRQILWEKYFRFNIVSNLPRQRYTSRALHSLCNGFMVKLQIDCRGAKSCCL